jgi:hypothetical protein
LILDTFHLFNIIVVVVVVVVIIAYIEGLALRCGTFGSLGGLCVGASDVRSLVLSSCAGMYSRLSSSDTRQLTTGEVFLESGMRVVAWEVDGRVVALHVGAGWTGRHEGGLGG